MKHTQKNFIALSALAVPLVITIGCAGTDQKLTNVNDSYTIDSSSTERISKIDSYIEPAEPTIEKAYNSPSDTMIDDDFNARTFEATKEVDLPTQYQSVNSLEEFPEVPQLSSAEVELTEPSSLEYTGEPIIKELEDSEDISSVDEVIDDVNIIGQPQQTVIQFEFDKHNVEDLDIEFLKKHAEYLIQYPNLTLVITGHTDTFGPSSYNQRLSELRANSVASILLDEGVPDEQLKIAGLGDAVPVTDPNKHRENRRVELTYQDSMLVSNQ